jgi:hypothetical protein
MMYVICLIMITRAVSNILVFILGAKFMATRYPLKDIQCAELTEEMLDASI